LRWDVTDHSADGFSSTIAEDLFFSYQPLGVYAVTGTDSTKNDLQAPNNAKNEFVGAQVNLVDVNGTMSKTNTFALSGKAYRDGSAFTRVMVDGKPTCTGEECLLDYHTGFTLHVDGKTRINILSRMIQSHAIEVAQTAFFVAVIITQWANLIVCRTRLVSLVTQGMNNSTLNMGLVFETVVGAAFCYSGFLQDIFRTQNIRLTHWFCALPFSLFIFAYDEMRKFILRGTSISVVDAKTGRIHRTKGWIERNTYY
jgi:sodium/potassium-transporting ATPase subunit alpha